MAGEGTIGAIRVVLGADTARFEESLRSAAGSLEGFGKSVAKVAAGIGIGVTAEKAFGQVVEAIGAAIDAADKLSKASQKFGIPVETLSALSNAAALSDVALDELGSSLSRLSKNMVSAQAATSEQATAFRALGVSTKDASGQFKSTDEILLAVADSFSKFRDGATKTALAIAIFGKAGADLIPFLNEGKAGIADLTGRMQELGSVINSDTAKAAEKFNDDLKLLEQAKTALILKIVGESGLLNAMVQLTEAMLGGSRAATQIADVFTNKFGAAIVEVQKFIADVNAGLATFGAGGQTQSFLKSVENIGTTAAAAQAGGIDKLIEGVKSLEDAERKAATAPPVFDPEAAKKLQQFNDALAKLAAETNDAALSLQNGLAPGLLTAAQHMDFLKGQVQVLDGGILKLGPDVERLNQAMLVLQGTKIASAETLTEFDVFQQKIEALSAAFDAGKISQEQFVEAGNKLSVQFAQSWAQAGSQVLGYIAGGFAELGKQSKEFLVVSKAANIAKATMDGFAAAVSAYNWGSAFGGPIGGAAAAALALAATAGYIAKIQATPFAMGGSFKVPGGVSRVDSHLIPLALSSGEQVSVMPAGQGGGGGRANTITLAGIGPRDFFSGTMLRDLVEALNRGHRDGYRLKLGDR